MAKDSWAKHTQRVEDKYQRDIAAASEAREEALAAIEVLRRVSTGSGSRQQPYGSFTTIVKDAIQGCTEQFSKRDVLAVIDRKDPCIMECRKFANLAGCLVRLEKRGVISRVSSGTGSIPTVYKKTTEE